MRLAGLLLSIAACGTAGAQTVHDVAGGPAPPELTRDGEVEIGDGYLNFLLAPVPRAVLPPPRADGSIGDVATQLRIRYETSEPAGTVLIDTAARRLYLIESGGFARSYPVGVGREGFGWHGVEQVSAMRRWPDWRPPADMLARRPDLPRHMVGGPANPLGARAIYLGSTLYRIHGSNEPETVGQAASSGCFRMTNADVADLYERVRIGARVRVF